MSNFFLKTATSFQRKRIKRDSIKKVLKNPQHNNGVVNIHRLDPTNVGDYYCAPHLYFEELKETALDIFDYKVKDDYIREKWINKISENSLIIGGGGLLNRQGFTQQMKLFQKLGDKGKKTIIWGAGHNSPNSYRFGKKIKYSVDTSKFDLVGVRDYGRKENWVPCVSCMHHLFDQLKKSEYEIGILFHKKTLRNPSVTKAFAHLPSCANNTSITEMVNFINKCDTLLTDSYHAMYWGILLQKKVMVFPNSTKFYEFKYPPVISTYTNWKKDLHKLQAYSGVLEECREINKEFSKKVFDYLNI